MKKLFKVDFSKELENSQPIIDTLRNGGIIEFDYSDYPFYKFGCEHDGTKYEMSEAVECFYSRDFIIDDKGNVVGGWNDEKSVVDIELLLKELPSYITELKVDDDLLKEFRDGVQIIWNTLSYGNNLYDSLHSNSYCVSNDRIDFIDELDTDILYNSVPNMESSERDGKQYVRWFTMGDDDVIEFAQQLALEYIIKINK